VIANNIVSASSNPIVKYYSTTSLAGVSFTNNIFYPTEAASVGLPSYNDSQLRTIDPELVLTNCRAYNQNCANMIPFNLFKLTSSSPAVNASTAYDFVTTDFEGQPAVGIRDIGADEYNTVSLVVNGPMDETKAGPEAPENYTYELNAIAEVENIVNNDILIMPNPFNGTTQLTIHNTKAGKISVNLYNTLGEQIQQNEIEANEGMVQMKISTKQKGLLFCLIQLPNKTFSLKFISK